MKIKRLNINENKIQENECIYKLVDLQKAFEAGKKMSWTDGRQESQEPYYYDFDDWFNIYKVKKN